MDLRYLLSCIIDPNFEVETNVTVQNGAFSWRIFSNKGREPESSFFGYWVHDAEWFQFGEEIQKYISFSLLDFVDIFEIFSFFLLGLMALDQSFQFFLMFLGQL